MTFITFPIAHSPRHVNPQKYVFYLTLLLLGDDTPDVIPRHTMLRHAQYVSVNRNFRLTPVTNRDFRPLPYPSIYASPLVCALGHIGRWRGERSEAAKRLSTPPPRPADPYSLVSRETCEHHPRPRAPLPRGVSCPRSERSSPALTPLLPTPPAQLKM